MTTLEVTITLDQFARMLGVRRHPTMLIPCSGCGIGCRPVEPLCCFCISCYAAQRTEKKA